MITLESVVADNVDLIKRLQVIVRQILSDIAETERKDRKRSKRERAISRWQIYMGVMLLKASEGVEALLPTNNVRAMVILNRSMYEYQQKAQYFLTHRKEAFEQYGSIGARQYAELSKLAHPDPHVAVSLTAAYLDWKRTSGNRNERSGDVGLLNMSRYRFPGHSHSVGEDADHEVSWEKNVEPLALNSSAMPLLG